MEFLGSRRDVPALLGQSDVFVFSTTKEEGLGTVLIEALAAGLPVVASDVPACREALEGGKWGALVPAADAAGADCSLCYSDTDHSVSVSQELVNLMLSVTCDVCELG